MVDYLNRITPDNITSLKPNEVFVFGSNLAGRHGAGAANTALQFGAKYGVCFDHCGQTFAIPTKGKELEILPLEEIALWVHAFIVKAMKYDEFVYLVTPIGTGLAGYSPEQIAPFFKDAIDIPNIHLPKRFWEVLLKDGQ